MAWSSSFMIRVQNPRCGLSRGVLTGVNGIELNRMDSFVALNKIESNRIVFFFAESLITNAYIDRAYRLSATHAA